MSANRFLFPIVWSIATFVLLFITTGPLVENYYNATVAAGGDPTFTGLGFQWLTLCAAVSLVVYIVGMFGKLPFTK